MGLGFDNPKDAKRWRYKVLGITLFVAVVIFVCVAYDQNWTWTGLPNQPDISGQPTGAPKSLWDWFELFIVPLVLAGGGIIFTQLDRANDRDIAKQQWEQDLQIEEARRQEDSQREEARRDLERELADANNQEEVVQTYFDRMSELLITHGLGDRPVKQDIRIVARARTLSTLERLDPKRKADIVRFLYEAGLIADAEPIVSLQEAYLESLPLDNAYLMGINLTAANLRNSDFEMATLVDAKLHSSTLNGVSFMWARLSRANLNVCGVALRVSGPEASKADIVQFQFASLVEATFVNAYLPYAQFDSSDCTKADFRGAKLMYASFRGADLKNATFDNANIEGADFTGAYCTLEQLKTASMRAAKVEGMLAPSVDPTDLPSSVDSN